MNEEKSTGNKIMFLGIFMLLFPLFVGGVFGVIYAISLISWTTKSLAIVGLGVYMLISIILTFIGLVLYNKK